MKIYFLTASLFLSVAAFAQTPNWLWAKSAGGINYDMGSSVTTDASGNVIVTGNFQSPSII